MNAPTAPTAITKSPTSEIARAGNCYVTETTIRTWDETRTQLSIYQDENQHPTLEVNVWGSYVSYPSSTIKDPDLLQILAASIQRASELLRT